jgi:hypothetical protein
MATYMLGLAAFVLPIWPVIGPATPYFHVAFTVRQSITAAYRRHCPSKERSGLQHSVPGS